MQERMSCRRQTREDLIQEIESSNGEIYYLLGLVEEKHYAITHLQQVKTELQQEKEALQRKLQRRELESNTEMRNQIEWLKRRLEEEQRCAFWQDLDHSQVEQKLMKSEKEKRALEEELQREKEE